MATRAPFSSHQVVRGGQAEAGSAAGDDDDFVLNTHVLVLLNVIDAFRTR